MVVDRRVANVIAAPRPVFFLLRFVFAFIILVIAGVDVLHLTEPVLLPAYVPPPWPPAASI
jgi:hypothetical protein